MPAITSTAPGKIILCGEHAVVYGSPAIALPVFEVKTKTTILAHPTANTGEVRIIAPCIQLDSDLSSLENQHPLRLATDLVMLELGITKLQACEIRINTTIPLAAGLGSSASVTVSLVKALSSFLGHPLAEDAVNRIAFEVEKIHHVTPSGIDNTVITYQAPVFFQKGLPIEHLNIRTSFTLVIADSGSASPTAATVAGVRERWLVNPNHYDSLFYQISEISRQIRMILCEGDLTVNGFLLTKNHELLREMGVSTPVLDHLVSSALEAGATGAKLSGGGGGGNIIAIVDEESAMSVARAMVEDGATRTIISSVQSERSKP